MMVPVISVYYLSMYAINVGVMKLCVFPTHFMLGFCI
jgi:hypothetical protein